MGSGSSKMFLVTMRCILDGQNGQPVEKEEEEADSTFELLAIRTLGQFTIFLQYTLFFLLVEKVNSLS
jgi:hypothetical protein